MHPLTDPFPLSDLMARPQLLRRVALGPDAPDLALIAGAGSGRTSVLRELARAARAAGIEAVWLDETVATPGQPGFGGLDVLARLNPAPAATCRLVLVDDADRIDAAQLGALIDGLRPCQIVMAAAPGFQSGASLHLTQADLSFSPAESAAYLGAGCPDPAGLHAVCQGNPLALCLVRGLMGRGLPVTPAAWGCAPVGAGLADWLGSVFVPTLPPEVWQFLLAIAPLDAVDGDLGFAVTGQRDAWALLDRLGPLGIPVERREPMSGQVRLHPVFREYLLRAARRAGRSGDETLRRAAGWMGAQGRFRQAAATALQGHDPDQARQWADAEGGWRLVIRGEGTWLSRLSEGLSTADLARLPRLGLGLALHLSRMGDPSGARDLLSALPRTALLADDRLIVDSILDGYEDRPFHPEDERRLRGLLARRGENDPLLRGVVTNVLAARYLQHGRFHEVTALAETSARAYSEAGALLGAALVRCHAAQAWGFLGEAGRGLEVLDRVTAQPAGTGMAHRALAATAAVLRAEILCRLSRCEEAAQLLRGALAEVENGDAWHDVLAAAYQTLLRLPPGLRPFGEAPEVIRRGLALAERRALPRLRMLLAVHAGADLRGELLASLPPPASWPPDPRRPALASADGLALGPREAEALRHLADGLTIKEIAVSMGLSENTVKYHVKRLHTRLGVGRRSQLLQAARRLGLLS